MVGISVTSLCLFGIFFLLQVVDIVTTTLALKTGRAREANPFIRAVMDKLGVIPALVLLKVLMLAPVGYLWVLAPLWLQTTLNLIYLYVVLNNINVILKIGR